MKIAALLSSIVLAGSVFASSAQATTVQSIVLGDAPAIRVTNVSQYENLMPHLRVPGEVVPSRLYTIVDFVATACKTLSAKEFEVTVQGRERAQLLEIHYKQPTYDCMGPVREQKLTITTNKAVRYMPIVIANPVPVEQLPDAH